MQMSRAKRRLNGPARTFMTSLRRSKAAVWTVDDTCGSFDRMNIHNVSRPAGWQPAVKCIRTLTVNILLSLLDDFV